MYLSTNSGKLEAVQFAATVGRRPQGVWARASENYRMRTDNLHHMCFLDVVMAGSSNTRVDVIFCELLKKYGVKKKLKAVQGKYFLQCCGHKHHRN